MSNQMINQSIPMGGNYSCGCKKCYEKNGGTDVIFKSYQEFMNHVNQTHSKVSGSTICKYCKKRYEFGKKFEGGKFNPNRPSAQIVDMKDAMHPECKIKYFEEQGLEVKDK